MNNTFILNIKERLKQEKKDLVESNLSATSDEVDSDGDETDNVQANMIYEMSSKLSKRYVDKIKQIDSALERIENNSYGECEDCGDEIPEKRLEFNPCFVKCVLCAEKKEFARKQGRY